MMVVVRVIVVTLSKNGSRTMVRPRRPEVGFWSDNLGVRLRMSICCDGRLVFCDLVGTWSDLARTTENSLDMDARSEVRHSLFAVGQGQTRFLRPLLTVVRHSRAEVRL